MARIDTTFQSLPLQDLLPHFRPEQILTMADGGIRLVGKKVSSPRADTIEIVGLLPDGALDLSFGKAGELRFPGEIFELGRWPLAETPDGGLLIMDRDWSPNWDDSVRIRKFTREGEPDSLFGRNGVIRSIPTHYFGDMCVYPDGRFAVGGQKPLEYFPLGTIAWYLPDGTLDRTYFGTGLLERENLVGRMALQRDGKLLMTGLWDRIDRFNLDGTEDLDFGVAGTGYAPLRTNISHGTDIHSTEGGRVLGFTAGNLWALNDRGIRDVAFGQGGAVPSSGGFYLSEWSKIRELPDHRIAYIERSPLGDSVTVFTGVTMLKANGQRDTSWFGGTLFFEGKAYVRDFDTQAGNVLVLRNDGMGEPGRSTVQRYIPGQAGTIAVQSEWTIFPNPSAIGFNIVLELNERQFVDLALFDVQGRRIANIASGGMMDAGQHELWYEYPWDISPGVYWVVLSLAGDQRVQKVLKMDSR
jgi:hypothetical protein